MIYVRLIIVLILLLSKGVCAEYVALQQVDKNKLPIYYPSQFEQIKTISSINVRKSLLEADALHFKIWNNTKVHLLNKKFGTVSDLKSGMVIGFSIKKFGNGNYINEIWQLPLELKPPLQ
ncbi:hypothetical protein H0A36_23635 [Endozoicomonas sp. SM1973]|uniref:DUF5666 domain-containing protein n=1 Tax=Spartinivicinus marinus TaxID=2994442 RepID=A0A853IHW9_9GAMM|nr:hypothetical protein [Spartinivicinus marinus]MCX4026040.1 hypothetical protein [Spartinivicinus marinus]NYZ69017.1 hypothetical protein [Spartinivicinus marinus]